MSKISLEEMNRKLNMKEETSVAPNILSEYHKDIIKNFIVKLNEAVLMRVRNDNGLSQQLKMLKDNVTFMTTDLKNKLGISN